MSELADILGRLEQAVNELEARIAAFLDELEARVKAIGAGAAGSSAQHDIVPAAPAEGANAAQQDIVPAAAEQVEPANGTEVVGQPSGFGETPAGTVEPVTPTPAAPTTEGL